MPFEPGQRVVAATHGLGDLAGRVVREARDEGAPAVDGARVYVVEWTLEDGSTVSNTTAEGVLRAADEEGPRG
jgi:hypothetical protein